MSAISIWGQPVILQSRDIIDGRRLYRPHIAVSPNDRIAIYSNYDFGSGDEEFADKLTQGVFQEGRFIADAGFRGINDSGQLAIEQFTFFDDRRTLMEYFVDDQLKLSSDHLEHDGLPVGRIFVPKLTSDGNIISEVGFLGRGAENGATGFYFNEEPIFFQHELQVDGAQLKAIIHWSANQRGDIVFMGQFEDGVDRLVLARRHIPEQFGDVNNDNAFDLADVNSIAIAMREGDKSTVYDLSGDGQVDLTDIRKWVHDVKNTYFGDADLNGLFDSRDIVRIFQQGEYEDDRIGNSAWLDGDWNGDGEFSSGDLILAFQDDGYERDRRAAAESVPEPTGPITLVLMLTALWLEKRRWRPNTPR
jgi:hypothetical protein